MDSLEGVAQAVRACTDCPLHRGRTNAVPGEGNPSADLMFIGEGPGFHEDRQGRPFVGPAGQLLEGLLASIGTNRDEVFIANMVKCRPPDNRDPQPPEVAACSKYLERQIELVNPKLIVTLGRFSLGRFFPGESVTRARGRLREKDGRQIFPVLHPAAALRRPELRTTLVEDFRAIATVLATAPEPAQEQTVAPAILAGATASDPAPVAQMDLFGAVVAPAPPAEPEEIPGVEQPDDVAGQDRPEEATGPRQLSMF
jgi:DNA polymerase